VIVGFGETLTVATAVFEQPAIIPVTVYDVVEDGFTTMGLVVAPVLHE
jgi:ABC-type sulfate transport system permease component